MPLGQFVFQECEMNLRIFNYNPSRAKNECIFCGEKMSNIDGGRIYCFPCYEWQEGSWRKVIFERDGGECFYCSKKLTLSNYTTDHIIPVHHRGRNIAGNIVCCCRSCNSKKHKNRILNERVFLRKVYERNFLSNIPNDLVMPKYRWRSRGWQREVSYQGKKGNKHEFRY